MNILYFAALNENDETKIGIKNKIHGQCLAMEKLGHNVWLARFKGKDLLVTKLEDKVLKLEVGEGNTRLCCSRTFHTLMEFVDTWGIHMLYIRLPAMSMSTCMFLRYMHHKRIIIMMELYTYPINKERIVSAFNTLKKGNLRTAVAAVLSLIIDNLYYPFLRTVVDRLVVLLPVKKIWGIKTIYIQNGIDTDLLKQKAIINENKKITIIGVAYLSYWHGYDRFIKGIKAYYQDPTPNKKQIEFIIIGDGEQRKKLEEYVVKNHLKFWVHFVGVKNGSELDYYYDLADVGVADLGMHRKKTAIVPSLKSREYFAKGLPFIDIANDDAISEQVSKYCLKVPRDESDINMDEVIDFAEKFKFNIEAHKEMRNYACSYMDWKNQMSIIIDNYHQLKKVRS